MFVFLVLFFFVFYTELSLFFFFFFSSRRRHTRLQGDWSSDVCSSDLPVQAADARSRRRRLQGGRRRADQAICQLGRRHLGPASTQPRPGSAHPARRGTRVPPRRRRRSGGLKHRCTELALAYASVERRCAAHSTSNRRRPSSSLISSSPSWPIACTPLWRGGCMHWRR